MKRFFGIIAAVLLIVSLTACSSKDVNALPSPTTQVAATSPADDTVQLRPDSIVSVSMPAATNAFSADDGTEIFYFTYQNMYLVLSNPNVAEKVIAKYKEKIDWIHTEAQLISDQARVDYSGERDWNPYSCQLLYNTTRIDHDVLSFFGNQVLYFGDGRPSRKGVALNFDLQTGDILTLGSVMHANASMSQFQELVANKLSEVVEEYYLYEDYADAVMMRFSADESQYEEFYFTPTGLCFYFDIYEIAPSASGIISVEIPYSELLGLLNDAYFPAERDDVTGYLYQKDFNATDMTDFSSITEAILSETGNMTVFYTDSTVFDIRIETNTEDNARIPYTLYASYTLNETEAVVVEGTNEQLSTLRVNYTDAEGTHVFSP